MTSGDASEGGSIVTAPRRVEQKGHNGTWRVLAKLSVSSEPGNEVGDGESRCGGEGDRSF
jgi:hypothetical protein